MLEKKIKYLQEESFTEEKKPCGAVKICKGMEADLIRWDVRIQSDRKVSGKWELKSWTSMEKTPEKLFERDWSTKEILLMDTGKLQFTWEEKGERLRYLVLMEQSAEHWIWLSEEEVKLSQGKTKERDVRKIEMAQTRGKITDEPVDKMKQKEGQEAEVEKTQKIEREEGMKKPEKEFERLKQRYGLIFPFDDEQEAISMVPACIHRISEEYRSLEGNSFLLHGFYQYRHIILLQEKRKKRKEEPEYTYLLGVPAIYCQQEKMIAEMFGFPEFKESRYGNENGLRKKCQQGCFGYFLREIVLIGAS